MAEERLRKLGIEKNKVLKNNFDNLYEIYKKKASDAGCEGELRFIHTHGRVIIYVVL